MEISEKKKIKPFLDFMLSESNFTNEEIENEVQTFMFAVSKNIVNHSFYKKYA